MGAVGRFVHPMSLLQQLKEFLHWDSWIRRAPQGEDLPQQHPIGPSEHTQQHTHSQWLQIRGQTVWSSKRWERGLRSPDRPGEILIFNNVYCNQFKNQSDILALWESWSIFIKTQARKETSEDWAERFFFGNPFGGELNKDIWANRLRESTFR